MIDVTQLSKAYGQIRALNDVSFSIRAGEIVGLLGPNGAGKTTIIKTLTGYLQPDSGTVLVDGLNVLDEPEAVQARIGYLPENAPLYPELTVQQYLGLMADLRQIPSADRRERLADAIFATGLQDRLAQPIGQLSKGFRQRVGLAQAILHRPRLLILDEPTVGLDPTQIVEIRQLIKRLAANSTVLFSTHILPEVEALCDRVLILVGGQVRADARLSELASARAVVVRVAATEAVDAVGRAIRAVPGVAGVTPVDDAAEPFHLRVTADGDIDLAPALFDLAVARGWQLHELRQDTRTLEAVFNAIAAGSPGDAVDPAPEPALDAAMIDDVPAGGEA